MGMIIDLAIRQASQNKKSLDDVMRFMYREYYQKHKRGFTDAEFQSACEQIAGKSLAAEFDYVYTTQPINYNQYLGYAGLELVSSVDEKGNTKKTLYRIQAIPNITPAQSAILRSWLGE